MTDAELIAMAYPRDAGDVGSTRRSRLQRVREALDYLVSIGYADCQPGQRLLPGPDWAGWEVANAKVSDGETGDAKTGRPGTLFSVSRCETTPDLPPDPHPDRGGGETGPDSL